MKDPYKSPDKIVYDSATGSTFKEAFAEAREEGQKTFEWNGKKYGTKLKGEDEPKQGKVKEDSTIETGKNQKSAPKEDKKEAKKEAKKEDSRGAGAALAATGTALGTAALLSAMRKANSDRKEVSLEKAATERANRAKSGTSLRMPGASMDKNDPYSMTLGSDLDPKRMMKNTRMSGDISDYKKGGNVKKMASGGSASSRGDGIAQRGKTKGRMR